ncbi:MAG: amidohydrolase family protein [Melioribacteraceae bacterium]|nr:amidohydrolase family protein [Melioribacteraceae bacterium]
MQTKLSRRTFIKTASVAGSALFMGISLSNKFDLIIKNAKIVDGSGRPVYKNDIGIIGNKVVAIDDLANSSADIILDVAGKHVSPGFIDIHTHTDKELLVNNKAESKIRQGVTTEVGGNCGSSVFPLLPKDIKDMRTSGLEKYGIEMKWKNIDEFFSALEKNKTSINYASFTGHGDIRAFTVGRNDVEPTKDQLKKMKWLISESMEMGSLGLSTGLEYSPGSYAKTDELIELCKTVASKNGVYATHMRNEDDTVEEAIQEALDIAEYSKVSLQISHLKACNKANWHKVENMLRMIGDANKSGIPVHADRYPYIAYGTGLSAFLPLWARQGNTDDVIERLKDKNQIKKIYEYTDSRGIRIGGWDRVVISSCSEKHNKKWEGMSIKDCAGECNKSELDFIKELLIEERLNPGIVGFAMDEKNLEKVLADNLVMAGSDGTAVAPYGKLGTGKPHPRYYGTFPRVIGKFCREDKIFDLQTAIKKMTLMPAEKLNLKNRGQIKKGYYADLVVFNFDNVIDKATFKDPHNYPTGIEKVIVNGKLTINDGVHTGALNGDIIRHKT